MPVYALEKDLVFPPPELAREDGLLAVGGDLSVDRLILAYGMGIFPWYSEGEPILWWSPDPRMVLFPDEFHASKSLRRTLKRGSFSITMDTAFLEVVEACAAARYRGRERTWITPEMLEAYGALHEAGYAHSVECRLDGQLAGGLYGVSLGACFFGESMFSAKPSASKVALASLVSHAQAWGFNVIDCQVASRHLETLGAREIPRADFLRLIEEGLQGSTRRGWWRVEVEPKWARVSSSAQYARRPVRRP